MTDGDQMSCSAQSAGHDDLPEYSLGLQTVGLLEEVDTGHHDGGDGAVLVVNDPLQGDPELLAVYPAGHGEVGGGHGLGQPVLLLVVLPHRVGYGQGVDVHVLLQLGEMIDVLDFTSEFCTKIEIVKPQNSAWILSFT